MTIYSALNQNKKYINRVKNSSLAMAFLLNGVFLLCAILFCDIKYEVSDDFMMEAVLSGAFGQGYNAHLLFSNIFLGYGLKIMYMLIPIVSWYFIFQISVCFLSLTAVTYVILEHNQTYAGMLISFLFITFFSDDVYILPQFTKAAALSLCAGAVLFMFGLWECHGKKKTIVLGTGFLLILSGSLIRFSCIYVVTTFWGVLFLKYVWDRYHRYGLKKCLENGWHLKVLSKFLSCVVVITGMYLLSAISSMIWIGHPDYASYKFYNNLRSSVVDMKSYGYESVAVELDAIGFDVNDYQMISSWNSIEEKQYPDWKLEKVAQIKKDYHREQIKKPWAMVKALADRKYWTYMPVIGIILLLFSSFLLKKANKGYFLIQLGIVAGYLIYFAYHGRQVYRVEYGVLLSAAICIATTTKCSWMNKTMRRMICSLVIFLGVCKIPLYLPDVNRFTMSDKEYISYTVDTLYNSSDYNVCKYGIDVYARPASGELIQQMETDKEHYYLIDFSTGIQLLYFNYKPWLRIEQGYFQNYSYLGGVDTRHPAKAYTWALYGIDEKAPYKDIVQEHIYLVDNGYYQTKFEYLKKHYYPNARAEVIANIDGYYIWKFYAQ